MGFPRQEYWSGLPNSSPGDLPDLGIKPTSLVLAGRFFTTEPPKTIHVPNHTSQKHLVPLPLSFLMKNQVCDPIKVSRTVTSNSL